MACRAGDAQGITRRRLLVGSGALAVGTFIELHPLSVALAGALGTPACLRRATYLPLRGQSFQLSGPAGPVALRLLSISDLPRPGLAGADNAFSLEFSGAGSSRLAQGTHALSHPTLGSADLFAVPIERTAAQQIYQLIVDRSIGAPSDPPAPPASVSGESSSSEPSLASGGDAQTGGGHTVRHLRTVRRVSLHRVAGWVRCTITLEPGVHAHELAVWLMHGEHVLAAATHRAHGQTTSFLLHPDRHLRRGHYEIVVKALSPRRPGSPMVRLGAHLI